MRHPAPITCDFCKGEQLHDMLGIRIPMPLPTHRHVDVCRTCEEARLPDLRPMVAVVTLVELEEQRKKAQQPNAPARFKGDD